MIYSMTKQPHWDDLRANFKGSDGKIYLVRCPACKKENYAPCVISGQCAWCYWEEGQDWVEENED